MKEELLKKEVINYIDYEQLNVSYKDLSRELLKHLEEVGYVVVKNFNIDPLNISDAKEKFLI